MDRIDRLGDVVNVVAGYFGVPDVDIRSSRRTARLHRPRCIAVYLADRLSRSTRTEIGAAFGRDPAVIVMYCRAIGRELTESVEQQRLLRDLEQTVKHRWRMT